MCAAHIFFIFHSFILSTIKRVSSTWCLRTIPRSHSFAWIFNCSGGGYVRLSLYMHICGSIQRWILLCFPQFYSIATLLFCAKYKWSLCILTMRLFVPICTFHISSFSPPFALSLSWSCIITPVIIGDKLNLFILLIWSDMQRTKLKYSSRHLIVQYLGSWERVKWRGHKERNKTNE